MARSTSTTVRAYDGDVESLTQASSAGVGVRVIVDHREGFAYAGTLDEAVVLEALAEARDNATFGEPDEFNGLATPDGVEPADLDLWPEHLADVPTADKVALALELEAATKGRDPRVSGVRMAMFSDSLGEGAVATSTGIRAWGRAGMSYLMVQALAVQDGETQIAGGLSVGREVTDLSIDEAADDAVLRATRLLGSTKPATQRLTLVLEPRMTATILGIVGGMLNGEAVLKGRSPFADRVGEAVASPLLTFVDDPTDPRSLGAEALRRRGPGPPPQRARERRGAAGVPAQHLHRPPLRHGVHRFGAARRVLDARRGRQRPRGGAGHRHPRGGAGRGRARALRHVDGRAPLGREPRVGRLLRGRRRPHGEGRASWPSRSARPPSPRRSSGCCSTSRPSAPTSSGCRTARAASPSSSRTSRSRARSTALVPILHAIVLGITQGLSEFLPISSSGHLILVPWLFGWDDFAGDDSLEKAFDVALHLGTLVGAIAYFRTDILRYLEGRLHARRAGHRRPPASPGCSWPPPCRPPITGALFVDVIEEQTGSIPLIALMLIVFGLVLAWADSLGGTRTLESVRLRDALLMGAGQAVALQPGVSRSGVTMTTGRWLGLGAGRRGALRVPDEPADHGRRPPVQVVRPVQRGRASRRASGRRSSGASWRRGSRGGWPCGARSSW